MKRILVSLLAGCGALFLAWVGGFNFNERGAAAFWSTVFTIFVVLSVYMAPIWETGE
jgi:hypothetical protein